MSNLQLQLQQHRILVEQLKREAVMERINVSQAVGEMMVSKIDRKTFF